MPQLNPLLQEILNWDAQLKEIVSHTVGHTNRPSIFDIGVALAEAARLTNELWRLWARQPSYAAANNQTEAASMLLAAYNAAYFVRAYRTDLEHTAEAEWEGCRCSCSELRLWEKWCVFMRPMRRLEAANAGIDRTRESL